MREVMQKAQELAEAVLASNVYTKMKELEEEVQADPEAAAAMQTMIDRRKRVEDILSSKNMDPEELSRAGQEMQEAEAEMNRNAKIQVLKAARKEFSTMMDNVNRILRLVITGEVEQDDVVSVSCSGNCSGCSGCS